MVLKVPFNKNLNCNLQIFRLLLISNRFNEAYRKFWLTHSRIVWATFKKHKAIKRSYLIFKNKFKIRSTKVRMCLNPKLINRITLHSVS